MMREDWVEVMGEQIEAARDKPFKWGEHDCCLFAANVVLAMTGEDYAKPYRGKYKTAKGAFRLLKKRSLADTLTKHLDPVEHCNRGDVALISGNIVGQVFDILGICVGMRVALVKEDGGLDFIASSTDGITFWRVRN